MIGWARGGVLVLGVIIAAASGVQAVAVDVDFSGQALVEIVEQRGELPVLAVAYPWQAHQGASIEIRLFTREEADIRRLRPLFFTARDMRGEVTQSVYRVEDAALVMPVSETIESNDRRYQVLGDRNDLGRASVRALWRAPRDDPFGGVALVFPLLEPWALDRDLLNLELPEPAFDGPGRMRVWLLRGEKIVWQQELSWPGR